MVKAASRAWGFFPAACLGWICCLFLSACTALNFTPMQHPTALAGMPGGGLAVLDHGNSRLLLLDSQGRFTGAFGQMGAGQADLYRPWDIAADSAGNIYICNTVPEDAKAQSHDGVKVFNAQGKFLRELLGQDYAVGQSLDLPYGIDIDQHDHVYVLYNVSSILRVFDTQGKVLFTFNGLDPELPVELTNLTDVAVDDKHNLVYLSDQTSSSVEQFAIVDDGTHVALQYRQSLGTYGKEPGQFAYPSNLAVDDESGTLYVGDMANQRIQALDADGNVLAVFAPPEVPTWQVMGLEVIGDTLYAADSFNSVIWVFDLQGGFIKKIEVKP